ncbi:synaptonemal complex protein 2-like [Astyanax mexicanus]|uniref:Synaptonemal complex protein 2-like n=1 Tax=Astyanax mexicanus TaxID=7994 RepID=A0A8T2MJ49_ASTMX|nr:synaptonemal complex protein 2-like [Astyanax mexicanus]
MGSSWLASRLEEAFTNNNVLSAVMVLVEEKSSTSLVDRLDEVASRELHKNEFKNVTLILRAIEQIISKDGDCINRLVRQGVYMLNWFERVSEHLKMQPKPLKAPMQLMEVFYEVSMCFCFILLVLVYVSGNSKILELLLLRFGAVVIDQEVKFGLRLEAIKTINSMLDSASKESRKKICQSDDHNFLLVEFAKVIVDVGDYEMQVAISEALCRMTPKKLREELSGKWFSYRSFASTFTTIRVKEFETDCRIFLNELNSYFGDSRRVFSFPCSRAFLEFTELFKPQDELLKDFWVDFNLGTSCISFFVHDPEGTLWELIHLPKETLSSYTLRECDDRKLLSIHMSHPVSHGNMIGKMVQIAFDSKYDILTAVEKVYGGREESKLPEAPKELLLRVRKNSPVLLLHRPLGKLRFPFCFRVDQENCHHPRELVTVSETLNHTFLTDVSGRSHDRKPFMAALWRYQVVRAKTAIFSQSFSSNGSVSSVKSLPSTSREMKSVQKRKGRPFLSESESRSPFSEKRSSQQTPQSDYTRKKPRVKSRLKVLPLSSPSSNEDEYKESTPMRRSLERERAESALWLQSKQGKARKSQDISRTSKGITADSGKLPIFLSAGFQERTVLDDTVFIEDHGLSIEQPKIHQEPHPPPRKKTQLSTELQEGPEVSEARLVSEEESPFLTFKPRRLFPPSTPLETATESMAQTLLEEEESETELGSGVTAAFNTFKTQLREHFSSRYKKIEAKSMQSLTDCQKNVTSLLRTVHNQRLVHLEHFHDTVVQQLGELEQNCLSLKNIEKETVRFWQSESDTVKSFCAEQQKRLDSLEIMKESVQEQESRAKSSEAMSSGAHPSHSTAAPVREETEES